MSLAWPPFARRTGFLSCLLTCAVPVAAVLSLSMAARGDETAEMAEALMHANSLSKAFRHAAEQAIPSVVVVRSETKAKKVSANRGQGQGQGQRQGQGQNRGGENPFKGTPFEDFFKDGVPEGFEFNQPEGGQTQPRSGVGSGVIVDKDGLVLTLSHCNFVKISIQHKLDEVESKR